MDIMLPPLGRLEINEPAPWFRAPVLGGADNFNFDTVAGRHALMLFYGSAAHPAAAAALRLVEAEHALFDDVDAVFFGITADQSDATQGRIAPARKGIRHFLDYDRQVSGAYGVLTQTGAGLRYEPQWIVVGPEMRIEARFALDEGEQALNVIRALRGLRDAASFAPVLVVPGVIEPAACRQLIDYYEHQGGQPSGFMSEEGGRTVGRFDHGRKRRSDHQIADEGLRSALAARIGRRLVPMIHRAFQFQATRIERYLLACYDGAEGGHFRAHRDNTTGGTAHRRFAVTINLNGDYDGGDLTFPEFGTRSYRAPVGGAVVFSCSLMHQANRVARGRRYAFLPFLYDEAAVAVRLRNNQTLGAGVGRYEDLPRAAVAAPATA